MRLLAFRIKNFRSIRDTGWHNLAHDNITCLIGQNESGKTSVLEGLRAYYNGELVEDMLRSDLSMPRVSCRFEFNFEKLKGRIDTVRIHPDILKLLSEIKEISLTRVWETDRSSNIYTGEELAHIFEIENNKKEKKEEDIYSKLKIIEDDIRLATRAIEQETESYNELFNTLCEKEAREIELKRKNRRFFRKVNNDRNDKELIEITSEINRLKKELAGKKSSIREKEKVLQEMDEKKNLRIEIIKTKGDIAAKQNNLSEAREKLIGISSLVGILPSEKEIIAAQANEDKYRFEIELAQEELEKSRQKYDLLLITAEKFFNGTSYHQATSEAEKELSKKKYFWNSLELGEELFNFIPEFEMFEDFSSLLPNRIDLSDILSANTYAEGYKAAVNFLTITGLDYSFFKQPSSRILKQKIEILNGELTLNFQDFWRQNVGKNNKIKINFELAHYDHSHAEKSGQPYIEFWIKDEAERLYPKQRSRGVRWFLSFFMELKATALDQNRKNKVLLIDEPGVSLHARAQEDVLKVFDDIKNQIQILYSTHSPHLIDVNKLYRIIAVQRAIEDDMNSETIMINSRSLKGATADTLSPVYSMMGARLNHQDIVKAKNNIVVKDLATFYYLKAIQTLTSYNKKECFFLPSSGPASMPMIINILIGWGLEYIVLNFGNEDEKFIHNKLRKELFENKIDLAERQLIFLREFMDVEDLFSTIDFKKYIVNVREGITVTNSEYLRDNNHSRAILASNFLQNVNQQQISLENLDDETKDNLNMLVKIIDKLLN